MNIQIESKYTLLLNLTFPLSFFIPSKYKFPCTLIYFHDCKLKPSISCRFFTKFQYRMQTSVICMPTNSSLERLKIVSRGRSKEYIIQRWKQFKMSQSPANWKSWLVYKLGIVTYYRGPCPWSCSIFKKDLHEPFEWVEEHDVDSRKLKHVFFFKSRAYSLSHSTRSCACSPR